MFGGDGLGGVERARMVSVADTPGRVRELANDQRARDLHGLPPVVVDAPPAWEGQVKRYPPYRPGGGDT
jgi:hypothetical protein